MVRLRLEHWSSQWCHLVRALVYSTLKCSMLLNALDAIIIFKYSTSKIELWDACILCVLFALESGLPLLRFKWQTQQTNSWAKRVNSPLSYLATYNLMLNCLQENCEFHSKYFLMFEHFQIVSFACYLTLLISNVRICYEIFRPI